MMLACELMHGELRALLEATLIFGCGVAGKTQRLSNNISESLELIK